MAGPVVAGAVILSKEIEHILSQNNPSEQDRYFFEINDSKKLTEKKREILFELLMADSRVIKAWAIIDAEKIDEINILNASFLAMQQAVEKLEPFPDHILVDGKPMTPRFVSGFSRPVTQEGIVKGDAKSISIAAASIIAKVTRDRLMLEYHEQFPDYQFDSHKGYGTKAHIERIRRHGPCLIHRKSFAPVKDLPLPGFQ